MRRPPEILLEPLVGAVARAGRTGGTAPDEITEAILDSALEVLAAGGLRRFTMEEIAAHGRLGRTTIYRRFSGRDELVHAVLAREVHNAFAEIAAAVEHLPALEDQLVEGLLVGLRAAEASPLLPLVRTEPELLRLVTVEAGPLIEVGVAFLVEEGRRRTGTAPTDLSRHTAELVVRFAMSLMLTPRSTLPLEDDDATRAALHALLAPLLRP